MRRKCLRTRRWWGIQNDHALTLRREIVRQKIRLTARTRAVSPDAYPAGVVLLVANDGFASIRRESLNRTDAKRTHVTDAVLLHPPDQLLTRDAVPDLGFIVGQHFSDHAHGDLGFAYCGPARRHLREGRRREHATFDFNHFDTRASHAAPQLQGFHYAGFRPAFQLYHNTP